MTCDCAANEEKVLGCFNTETAQEEFHALSGTIYVGCWNTGVQKELAIYDAEVYVVKWDQSIEKLYICVVTTSTTTTTTSTTTPSTTTTISTTTTGTTTVTTLETTTTTAETTTTTLATTTVTTTTTTAETTTSTTTPDYDECCCDTDAIHVIHLSGVSTCGSQDCSETEYICEYNGSNLRWECLDEEDHVIAVVSCQSPDPYFRAGYPANCFYSSTVQCGVEINNDLTASSPGCLMGIGGYGGTAWIECYYV